MYDTIVMDYSCPNGGLLKSIPNRLIDPKESSFEGVQYVTGYLPNGLKIRTTDNRLQTPEGNLGSYYLDNPFHTLRRGTTKEAIHKLSDELNLPMYEAGIKRIDIGNTFLLKHSGELYLDGLGQHQHFTRLKNIGSLYYKNKRGREMIFYGKNQQIKAKGIHIPLSKKGKNFLRYECKYTHQLEKVFQKSDLKVADIYDEDFYIHALTLWQKQYLEIAKRPIAMDQIKPTGSTKEFGDMLALHALNSLDRGQILSSIRQWYKEGQVNQKQATAIRAYLKRLDQYAMQEVGNDMIDELSRKVNLAVKTFR